MRTSLADARSFSASTPSEIIPVLLVARFLALCARSLTTSHNTEYAKYAFVFARFCLQHFAYFAYSEGVRCNKLFS